jgi:hypothetical protein
MDSNRSAPQSQRGESRVLRSDSGPWTKDKLINDIVTRAKETQEEQTLEYSNVSPTIAEVVAQELDRLFESKTHR